MPATWLYVPAIQAEKLLPKAAAASGGVILDLEDATHPAKRPEAREILGRLLDSWTPTDGVTLAVRVNHVASADFPLDVAAIGPLLAAGLVSEVHLPKVETPGDVAIAYAATSPYADRPHLACLVESARGLRNAHEVAEAPGVVGVSLGEADLRADLGLPRGEQADDGLLLARLTIVQAARAAGLPAPRGSVFANIKDSDGLRASCEQLRRLGFHGRSVIHPGQVAVVREVFAPTEAELAWAGSVAERADSMLVEGTASVALSDGTFIDPAIVRQAHDLLARVSA